MTAGVMMYGPTLLGSGVTTTIKSPFAQGIINPMRPPKGSPFPASAPLGVNITTPKITTIDTIISFFIICVVYHDCCPRLKRVVQ